MKVLPWIIAAAGIGAAIYVVTNTPTPQVAVTDPDVEQAASKTGSWGTKQRVAGTGGKLSGKLKESAGKVTGDSELESEGLVDQAAGVVKDTAGQIAHAASDSLHNLNKA